MIQVGIQGKALASVKRHLASRRQRILPSILADQHICIQELSGVRVRAGGHRAGSCLIADKGICKCAGFLPRQVRILAAETQREKSGFDHGTVQRAGLHLAVNILKRKYGWQGKHVLLGVASIWSEEKGLPDFIKLAQQLRDDEMIVLVGVTEEQKSQLPQNVYGIRRTENIQELAQLYSAADVFVNPTWQDNYPTVNMEAIACGTPVVTYRTGGSVEAVTEDTGFIVEQGDVKGLLNSVRVIEQYGKHYYADRCRKYALANFRKEDRYADYLKLYEELRTNRI